MADNAATLAALKADGRSRIQNQAKKNKGVTYQLLRDAYYGTGGFADGGYLVKHKREALEKYQNRQELAYFLNYTASAVNSHVDPIFRNEISRDWKGGKQWEQFVDDTDNAGTKIQGLAKRAALGAKLFGVNFVVMDNAPDQPATLAEVIEQRKFPYAFIVEPDRVVDVRTDKFWRLTKFSYKEAKDDAKDDDDYNIRTFTPTGWYVTDKDGKQITKGKYSIKRVPVTLWASREMDPAVVFQPSEFASIAKTNLAIYQLCSWLGEILQNQAFSVLIYPSVEGQNLVIGTNNVLGFSEEARNAPAFIAPPADPAKMITDQIDRLIQEIYRMANLTLVTGVQKQTSGVAKAWDFERTNQTLSDFAANCQAAEMDMADIFGRWTSQDVKYEVSYPSDFKIVDVADELANAETATSLELGSTFLIEVAKKVLYAYMPDLDDKTFDAIVEEIKKRGTDEMMSRNGDYAANANAQSLVSVIKELLQADGIDPELKVKAQAAIE